MVADLFKAAVEGGAFLLSVVGVFSGIHIDDQSPFVSAPQQGSGSSVEAIFKSFA
jgi:hypothetical protein